MMGQYMYIYFVKRWFWNGCVVLIQIHSVVHLFFKLNKKKKVPLKNMVWGGGVTRKFCWSRGGGGLMFNKGLEGVGNLLRKGIWLERDGRKIEGEVVTLKETMVHIIINLIDMCTWLSAGIFILNKSKETAVKAIFHIWISLFGSPEKF